jgi:hypothetical protein
MNRRAFIANVSAAAGAAPSLAPGRRTASAQSGGASDGRAGAIRARRRCPGRRAGRQIMVLNNECRTALDPSVAERHAWATLHTGLSSSGT